MLIKGGTLYKLGDYNPKLITEIKQSNDGRLILRDKILQRADAINKNGRVYPRQILERAAAAYNEKYVKHNNAIGELDHPDEDVVSLSRGALNITRMYWRGNDLMGDIEVLTHIPNGKILEGYLMHNITVGISSRGLGSVEEKSMQSKTVSEVQDDLDLVAFDAVKDPSTHNAYISESLRESANSKSKIYIVKQYKRIDSIIETILF